jgi:hypothetical protein
MQAETLCGTIPRQGRGLCGVASRATHPFTTPTPALAALTTTTTAAVGAAGQGPWSDPARRIVP